MTVFNIFLLKLRTTAPLHLTQVRKTVTVTGMVTGVTTASIHPMSCNKILTEIVLVSKIIRWNGSWNGLVITNNYDTLHMRIFQSHIFPENAIKVFDTCCYKKTNGVSIKQMMSTFFYFQPTLNRFFNKYERGSNWPSQKKNYLPKAQL